MRYGSLTYNACSCISHWLVQRLNIKSATLLDTGANEAVEYAWDANGNMTSDLNAGVLHVTYNALNHPSRVVTSHGAVVEHVYAADGRKLRSRHLVDPSMVLNPAGEPSQQAQLLSVTDYCGEYVLRNDTLERVMHQNRLWQMAFLSKGENNSLL